MDNHPGWQFYSKRRGWKWEVWYCRKDRAADPHNGATEWKASSLRFWRIINAERLAHDLTRHYYNGLEVGRLRYSSTARINLKD